jgi:glycosyltransferase involved in cell wall biosynthesis
MLPRISIVTPSYNQAEYVEMTVRSVLLQRYPNLEYIVMDGGSTDGSREILDRYADRFAHYQSQKDGGQSDAIHQGFARSSGEIMAYLNSDDLLAPGALHFVAEYFAAHPEVDAIYSHRCTIDRQNKVISYWILPPHSNYLMKRWDLIPQETCFWRRRLFDACGNIDSSLRFAMDYDLFLRYMAHGKFARVNRFLGAFRYHDDSKTSRLLFAVGHGEIKQVQERHGLKIGPRESMIGGLFSHVHRRRNKPGGLPGIGWDYDDVWGGQLRDKRLPPPREPAEPAARVMSA